MAEPTRRREHGDENVEHPLVGATEIAVEVVRHLDEVVTSMEHIDLHALPAQLLGGPLGLIG